MTTTVKKPTVSSYASKVMIDPSQAGMKYRLQVKLSNKNGVSGFGGTMLTEYTHPLTKKKYPLFNNDEQKQVGYMVSMLDTILDRRDPEHNLIIQWLICHPRVRVEGLDLTDEILKSKEKNPKLTLYNIDFRDIQLIDTEETIDEVKGLLSTKEKGKEMSIDRLRYLLAYFNLSYTDQRYVKDRDSEAKMLRKRLKDFVESNKGGNVKNKADNAQKVKAAIAEVDNYKIFYEIKEMLRTGLVTYQQAVGYKIDNVPAGMDLISLADFLRKNQDIYAAQLQLLKDVLKKE